MSHEVGELLYELLFDDSVEEKEIVKAFELIINNKDIPSQDIQLSGLFYSLMKGRLTPSLVYEILKTAFKMDGFQPLSHKIEGIENITCVAGSGKKRFKTLNISTFSAITAAATGAKIIKPGSSAVSSMLGSADLMSMIQLPVYQDHDQIADMLHKVGIAFFKIENIIPKFDSVYGGKFLTVNPLSYALPALLSPIKYDNLLYGLSNPNLELSADVLGLFGIENFMVVNASGKSLHYIDEMGVFQHNNYVHRAPEKKHEKLKSFSASKVLGIADYDIESIRSRQNPEENVRIMLEALRGRGESVFIDLLSINAASMLVLSNKVEDLREGFFRCRSLLKKGLAFEKFVEIVEYGKGNMGYFQKIAR